MRWLREAEPERQPTQTDWATRFKDPRNIVPGLVLTGGTLLSIRLYKRYLRRVPNVEHILPTHYRTRTLFGKVTSVGDGDNFRLHHTPGGWLAGWGWLPGRRVPTKKDGLTKQTVHIRIAGIDAPELAHFGRPAQPFGEEAIGWLTKYILGRRLRAHIWRRDQYDRAVATVYVRRWGGLVRKDVGLEMLKEGLATVYEAKSGAEFGKSEKAYRGAEEQAKRVKKGMWASKHGFLLSKILGDGGKKMEESPRDYKTRMAATEKK